MSDPGIVEARFRVNVVFRGAFLELASEAEQVVSELISLGLADGAEARALFCELILDDPLAAPFSKKVDLLRRISEAWNWNLPAPAFASLDKMRKLRNHLAHKPSDRPVRDDDDGRLRLVYFKGGRQKELVLSSKEMDAKLAEAAYSVAYFTHLRDRIREADGAGRLYRGSAKAFVAKSGKLTKVPFGKP